MCSNEATSFAYSIIQKHKQRKSDSWKIPNLDLDKIFLTHCTPFGGAKQDTAEQILHNYIPSPLFDPKVQKSYPSYLFVDMRT